jgi:cytochrome c553
MKTIFSYVFAISSILTAQLAFADQAAPIVGDATAGKQKISTCAACHGEDGNSPIATYPNLAGQHPEYIISALNEFQQGTRTSPLMGGMAAGLSAQDMADIAAYYSAQAEIVGAADPALVKQGEILYRAGDPDREIPACMACHGPVGDGNGPAKFPRVANQNPAYLIEALQEFRSGSRSSPNNMMNDISERLSDKDMQAVASYMYGLYPTGMKLPEPTPAAGATTAAAGTTAPATATTPAAATAPSSAATPTGTIAPAATAAPAGTTAPSTVAAPTGTTAPATAATPPAATSAPTTNNTTTK